MTESMLRCPECGLDAETDPTYHYWPDGEPGWEEDVRYVCACCGVWLITKLNGEDISLEVDEEPLEIYRLRFERERFRRALELIAMNAATLDAAKVANDALKEIREPMDFEKMTEEERKNLLNELMKLYQMVCALDKRMKETEERLKLIWDRLGAKN